jgi:hypothetical protein
MSDPVQAKLDGNCPDKSGMNSVTMFNGERRRLVKFPINRISPKTLVIVTFWY